MDSTAGISYYIGKCYHTIKGIVDDNFVFNKTVTDASCIQHNPTLYNCYSAKLNFLSAMAHNSPELNRTEYQI